MNKNIPEESVHKICILGDVGTGKTSFLKRYVHGIFSMHYKTTIGVDFALKIMELSFPREENSDLSNKHICRLQLWDIAGQERYGSMTGSYYEETSGVFIMVDCTRRLTLDVAIKWKNDFDSKTQNGGFSFPVILLINKMDLEPTDDIDYEKFDDICKKNGFATYFLISAKNNTNLNEAVAKMADLVIKRKKEMDKLVIKQEKEIDDYSFPSKLPDQPLKISNIINYEILSKIFTCEIMNDMREEKLNESLIIRKLKLILIDLSWNPAEASTLEKIRANTDLINLIGTMIQILTNDEIDDGIKFNRLFNMILECGFSINAK